MGKPAILTAEQARACELCHFWHWRETGKGYCHFGQVGALTGRYHSCKSWQRFEPWTAERVVAALARVRLSGKNWATLVFHCADNVGVRASIDIPKRLGVFPNQDGSDLHYVPWDAPEFLAYLNHLHLLADA